VKKLIGLGVILIFTNSCKQKTEYATYLKDPILFCSVVHELNTVVMGNGFPPIIASRNYTYASIGAYEVIAACYPEGYQSLAGQITDLPKMPTPKNEDILPELAATLVFIEIGEAVTFPEGSMQDYKDSILQLAKKKGMPEKVLKASQLFADTIATVLLKWSKEDNYAKTRGSQKYTPIDSPGRWTPTPPIYADAIEPNWRQIRTLVMDSAAQFLPKRPINYDITNKNSAYYKQLISVKNTVETLTPEQKHIADFWDDNPLKITVKGHLSVASKKFSPPGHWMGIVGIAAEKSGADFATTVYAYALTAIAKFDAFIQCWDEKYRSNYARPESIINKFIDPLWQPYLQTPPFPEYTCGHSTTSAAAAEALTKVFGDNFAYTDTTELEFGIPNRSFTSFRQAAEENNLARFYGGIHFHPSCLESTKQGQKVGELVVSKLKMKR
jgi:hypothetical protein